ncbi:hypothetical protein RUM43_001099 [Polyplax serrata]|uniref:Protein takeout n=1 Tax=Polyplax serrata TaxID=468196 RepID=A0AAN8SFQ7_POLSC
MDVNETNFRGHITLGLVYFFIYSTVFIDALIPDYIQVCRSTDPQLEKCINSSIEAIRSKLVTGIPELDVPPLEPLALNEVSLIRGPDGAKIEASVKNIKVFGPSNFIIKSLRANVKNSQFDFRVLLPKLSFKGDYSMNMRILLLKLQGQGVITGNLTNYRAEVNMKGDKIKRNGQKYLHMRKMKTKLDVGDVAIHLTNLFNGDPVLGPATNRILRSNSKLFLEEIQPALESSISEVFTDIANRITLKFTYDELFP